MSPSRRFFSLAPALLLLGLVLASPALAGTLTVTSTTPARNANNVSTSTTIALTFNLPLQTSSITASSFRVWGKWSGPRSGAFAFTNGNQTLTFTPSRPFSAGEIVYYLLATTVTAADTSPLRSGGYAFQFTTVVAPSELDLVEIDTVSVRTTPGEGTRLYGGSGADFDNDGWLDYVGANEDSGDLRVLMNRDDGSGLYHPFLQPPTDIDLGPSPNEVADYDNDGFQDVATANYSPSTVSVVLGHGDGTFGPQQSIPVGTTPHGLATLDVDGDGDLDLITANESANNMSRMLNNGSGVFGAASSFEGGGNGEYPVTAGDMNNDGLMDLVLGTRNDSQIHILTGNGNGTFTHASNRSAGGLTWMVAVGDVNGDGNLDVASANSQSNNGSILLGNGDGTLDAAVTVSTSGHMVATDLGDLDGDGDLDWVLSSFGGGRWHVYTNNGSGTFTEVEEIFATSNASCATLYDFDNDGDLDMALADEIADEVKLIQNSGGPSIFADGFETGDTAAWSQTVP